MQWSLDEEIRSKISQPKIAHSAQSTEALAMFRMAEYSEKLRKVVPGATSLTCSLAPSLSLHSLSDLLNTLLFQQILCFYLRAVPYLHICHRELPRQRAAACQEGHGQTLGEAQPAQDAEESLRNSQ